MNLRRIQIFFVVTLVEAILALIVILRPQTLTNNLRLGFSTSQALTGAPFIFIIILFGWFCFKAFTDEPWLVAAGSFLSRVASQQASLPALAWLIVWLVIINAAILSGTAQSVSVRLPVIFQVVIQRSAPPLVWLTLAAIQLYILLFYPASRALKAFVKPILISAIILVFLGLYVQGSVIQLEVVNIKLRLTDQSDYMNEAKKMVASHYTYSGARNRMPIYPFIQSLFYRPSMTNSEFFTQGKYLNLVLSVLILAFIAGIFFHYFNPYHALNMMLLISFMVFMFKAGYFQSELLFYFFTFLMFFLMWRFFTQPSIKVAISIGVVAGLGHLTKASILPGLFVFIIFAALQYGWRLLQRLRAQPRSYSGEILKPMLTTPPGRASLFNYGIPIYQHQQADLRPVFLQCQFHLLLLV